MWNANKEWLRNAAKNADSDWQIVTTHFPPEAGPWGGEEWEELSLELGLDLIVAGHRHTQEIHTNGMIKPTTFLVSGGGGGITSENCPRLDGFDDEYGFMDLTLTKHEIMIEAISHGGLLRNRTCITQRMPGEMQLENLTGTSLCEGLPSMDSEPLPTTTTTATTTTPTTTTPTTTTTTPTPYRPPTLPPPTLPPAGAKNATADAGSASVLANIALLPAGPLPPGTAASTAEGGTTPAVYANPAVPPLAPQGFPIPPGADVPPTGVPTPSDTGAPLAATGASQSQPGVEASSPTGGYAPTYDPLYAPPQYPYLGQGGPTYNASYYSTTPGPLSVADRLRLGAARLGAFFGGNR